MAQLVKIHLKCRRSPFDSWLRKIPGERIGYPFQYPWASLVAQTLKNLPATWETWVQSLGWKDPLEKGMITHSSIRASWVAQLVKNLPAMQETPVRFLGREAPLKKG